MPLGKVNKYAATYQSALSENPVNKDLNNSIAMCYLKLKLYDKALGFFEKAIEDNFDNSETFFYASICLLKGQKAFVQQRYLRL
jgi:tetratricopeptide (TPR) repeat protein